MGFTVRDGVKLPTLIIDDNVWIIDRRLDELRHATDLSQRHKLTHFEAQLFADTLALKQAEDWEGVAILLEIAHDLVQAEGRGERSDLPAQIAECRARFKKPVRARRRDKDR